MKTRGARARWAASPEGIAESERLAAEEKAELDREAAAAAAAALRRDAVRTGDAARLEEYLRAGADPCLAGACECGMSHPSTMGQHHPRLVRWTTGCDCCFITDQPLLFIAAQYPRAAPLVPLLVRYGAEVNHMYGGQTPVSTACRHGNVPTLKALIAAGADVNKMPPVANFHGTRIDNGRSPLWDAADQGARAHPERTEANPMVLEVMLDAGSRHLNRPSHIQYTTLWMAAGDGSADCVRTCLRRGAVINLSFGREDAEDWARQCAETATRYSRTRFDLRTFGGLPKAARCTRAADLLAQVKAAGSWRNYVSGARAQLVALRKLAETGRARPGDDTPPELTRLFPAHDGAARTKKKSKAPSRGAGLPDPLFRRVVMFWLG